MEEYLKQERELSKQALSCLEKALDNNKHIANNHTKTIILTSIISALVCVFITCTFIFSYFFGDYSYTTTNINENKNINSNVNERSE